MLKISFVLQGKNLESDTPDEWENLYQVAMVNMATELEKMKTRWPESNFRVIQRIESMEEIVMIS